jgi:hypothetical protein
MNLLTVILLPIKYFWDFYAISSTDEATKRDISKFSAGLRMFIGLSIFPAMLTFSDYYDVYRSQGKAIEVLEPYSGITHYLSTGSKSRKAMLRTTYVDLQGIKQVRIAYLTGIRLSVGSFSDISGKCLSVQVARIPHRGATLKNLETCGGKLLYSASSEEIYRDKQVISERRKLALILSILSILSFFTYPVVINLLIRRSRYAV